MRSDSAFLTPSNKSCHKTERRYNNIQPEHNDLLPRDIYTCTQKNHLTNNYCITSSSCAENVWKHYISVVVIVCMIWYVSLLHVWIRHTLNNLFHWCQMALRFQSVWVRLKFWLLIRKYILGCTCFYWKEEDDLFWHYFKVFYKK